MMIALIPYKIEYQSEWNSIIEQADNPHFMINRFYMDYHSDRFNDASFIVLNSNKTIGVIPGNYKNNSWYSHQGLTFGSLFLKSKYNRAIIYKDIYTCLFQHLKNQGVEKAIIKPIPQIYHKRPCENDLYSLSCFNITEHNIEASTAINLRAKGTVSSLRKRGVKKAKKSGLQVDQSQCFKAFWALLTARLEEKYQKKPVHTAQEIELLHERFPSEIKLFTVSLTDGDICGGTVIYETDTVAHAQYISASEEGMEKGALDLLFLSLIEHYQKKDKQFFDFGISTEEKGTHLNESLIQYKEGFGGGTVVHHTITVLL